MWTGIAKFKVVKYQPMRKSKKALFASVAIIVLIFVLVGCTAPQAEVVPATQTVEQPTEVARVSLEDAKAAFDNGAAVFVDVRSQSSYATRHIPGALSIPLAELEARISELGQDQWIITYCT